MGADAVTLLATAVATIDGVCLAVSEAEPVLLLAAARVERWTWKVCSRTSMRLPVELRDLPLVRKQQVLGSNPSVGSTLHA